MIVPVYNCENTLKTCVDSLLRQEFDDYEIILIDDGSEDNSGAICDDYHKENEIIRVVHKTNGGVSSACNFGIDYARGKYVMFCDSDDFVEPEWMKLLYNAIEVNPDDSVFCSFYKTDKRKNRSVSLSVRGGSGSRRQDRAQPVLPAAYRRVLGSPLEPHLPPRPYRRRPAL